MIRLIESEPPNPWGAGAGRKRVAQGLDANAENNHCHSGEGGAMQVVQVVQVVQAVQPVQAVQVAQAVLAEGQQDRAGAVPRLKACSRKQEHTIECAREQPDPDQDESIKPASAPISA